MSLRVYSWWWLLWDWRVRRDSMSGCSLTITCKASTLLVRKKSEYEEPRQRNYMEMCRQPTNDVDGLMSSSSTFFYLLSFIDVHRHADVHWRASTFIAMQWRVHTDMHQWEFFGKHNHRNQESLHAWTIHDLTMSTVPLASLLRWRCKTDHAMYLRSGQSNDQHSRKLGTEAGSEGGCIRDIGTVWCRSCDFMPTRRWQYHHESRRVRVFSIWNVCGCVWLIIGSQTGSIVRLLG